MRERFFAFFVCGVVAFTACDTGVDPQPIIDASQVDTLSASCQEATNHSDLDWIQTEIFDKSCSAFNVCHKGAAASAGGLNLEAGNSAERLVGQPSTIFPDWDLVVPGAPSESYLMVILGQADGPIDPGVGNMPSNSLLLCREKREAVERWIESIGPASPDAGIDAGLDAGVDAAAIDAGFDAAMVQ